ncbi:beta-glucoside-specific PTS transporter subunit IIABC [Lactobacillus sp. ESL0681]|uniref:beta-glucoside-specific PTS transporter subunit IIABC n=1 Tax=Lactobacillus sp. ESL0681 TaxID=2983211 RepID=UPI0023F6CFD0|nr:beta-glucoside-specific PTS transporter subunit IIABC [Lactobacillus sp. ESL0681]WEV40004.1 beta-glucoside-specific PTS transporter subunit IIABC [Lactobacillus sp. ESL0681]
MDFQALANNILTNVGGKDNVVSLDHCFTRLRFVLKDDSKANGDEIAQLEGVIQVMRANDQFQVVLGNNVGKTYDVLAPMLDQSDSGSTQHSDDKTGIGNKIINAIAAIFTPTIPALAASGMIKGVLAIAVIIATNVYHTDITKFDTYIIFNAASDALFYFMPIILARTSAKVFKTNEYIAMVIAGTLCYPSIVELMTGKGAVTLFGLQLTKASYTSSVIPIIIAVFILAYLERFIDKIMPEVLKIIMVPTLCLLIMVPATLMIFGPIGIYIGNFINWLYYLIMDFSPILLGAFIGGIWCVLVIFGAHRAIVPIGINDVAKTGHQNLLAFAGAANFSQAGAALGVFLKTKNKNLKTVSASATITALFGITEPAIYGANLRLKKPMIYAVISGALGGALMGWGGASGNAFSNQGVLTVPVYASAGAKGFACYVIGCLIAFFGACLLTVIFGFEDLPEKTVAANGEAAAVTDSSAKVASPITLATPVAAPLSGEVVALSQVADEVFASEAMGKGVAIVPSSDEIVAPSDCEVKVLYPTLHAIGLELTNGLELLIHIGKDTVELKGKYFTSHTEVGAHLHKGEPIVTFNSTEIKKAGYDLTTPVVITNADPAAQIEVTTSGTVAATDNLMNFKGKITNEEI